MTTGATDPRPITREAPPLGRPAVLAQSWLDASFLHWRVAPAAIDRLLPTGLRADTLGGDAWIGLIAFSLERTAFGPLPPVPYLGSFPEVNVRTYTVDRAGRRGVFFLSLDASRLAAVLAARALFQVPYTWARMSIARDGDRFEYRSRRIGGRREHCRLVTRADRDAEATDELSVFLTARWGLTTVRGGRLTWRPNAHEPWRTVAAEAEVCRTSLLDRWGLAAVARRRPDSVLFSPGVRTRFATGERID